MKNVFINRIFKTTAVGAGIFCIGLSIVRTINDSLAKRRYKRDYEKALKKVKKMTEEHRKMVKELDERIIESQTILEKIEKGEDLDYEKKPWTGDFDEFMSNPDNQLIFE